MLFDLLVTKHYKNANISENEALMNISDLKDLWLSHRVSVTCKTIFFKSQT